MKTLKFAFFLFLFLFNISFSQQRDSDDVFIFNNAKQDAEKGTTEAKVLVGLMYKLGKGVKQDYTKATKWLIEASNEENAYAQEILGELYIEGKGVTKDTTKAVQMWQRSASKGLSRSQYNLAIAYYNGYGLPQDYVQSYIFSSLSSAVNEEGAETIKNNSLLELDSSQVSYAQNKAMQLWNVYDPTLKNTQLILNESHKNFGDEHFYSYKIDELQKSIKVEDYSKLFNVYHNRARSGDKTAMYVLALMYSTGEGVSKNYLKGIIWLREVIRYEDAPSGPQQYYGMLYCLGHGVPQNFSEAMKWFSIAADRKNSEAQYNMGSMYEKGCGVRKNQITALMWYILSAEQGYEDGIKARDRLKSNMSEIEIEKSYDLSNEWKSKKNSGGLTISIPPIKIGDSISKVKEYFDISYDIIKEGDDATHGMWYYHFEEKGIWYFFDTAYNVRTIRYEAPFKGEVDGIMIGDSSQKVRNLKGEPNRTFWFGFNSAWIYSPDSDAFVRYDISPETGKVVEIIK